MTQKAYKRRTKNSYKVRKSEENEVNLIPSSHKESVTEHVIIKKNVNQLWRWDSLEDVKF